MYTEEMEEQGSENKKVIMSPEGKRRKCKVSSLTDEQITELMLFLDDEISTDEFDSDGSFADPDFHPQDCLELREITDTAISQCLEEMEVFDSSSAVVDEVNFSTNISSISLEPVEPVPSTSSASRFKPPKRTRSPLPEVELNGPHRNPSTGGFSGANLEEIDIKSKEFQQLTWKKKHMQLHVNEIAFQGNSNLGNSFQRLNSPLQCFNYFFDSEILKLLVEKTNRSARQENINTVFSISETQMNKFIGIILYMSLYRYPNMESYWSKNAFEPIRNTMSWRQFENIKRYLSFSDEQQRIKRGTDGYDPLYRIRNISRLINERFDTLPKTARPLDIFRECSINLARKGAKIAKNLAHKFTA